MRPPRPLVAGLLALVVVLLPVPSSASPPTHRVSGPPATSAACAGTPFLTSVPKRVVYRIPALVATPQGTLVAFAERRRSTAVESDLSDTEVVVARSLDRGCHWTAPRVVADSGTDTVGNPVPVVDATTGTILLFTVDRPLGGTTGRGLHLQRSTDDGLTFTRYRDARLDLARTPGWSGGLTGPGHAVQLQASASPHRGRIVVPLGYKSGDRYGTYGLVSDDHGAHWSVGPSDATSRSAAAVVPGSASRVASASGRPEDSTGEQAHVISTLLAENPALVRVLFVAAVAASTVLGWLLHRSRRSRALVVLATIGLVGALALTLSPSIGRAIAFAQSSSPCRSKGSIPWPTSP